MKEKQLLTTNIMKQTVYVLLSTLAAWAAMIDLQVKTNNIFVILVFAFAMMMFNSSKSHKKSIRVVASLTGGLFAIFIVLGKYAVNTATLGNALITSVGFFALFYAILRLLFEKIESINLSANGNYASNPKKVFLIILCLLLVFWLPYFLVCFPGYITEDSIWQLEQATGLKPYNTQHPILHTIIIKITYNFGLLISNGAPNIGVMIYTIVQTLFMGSVFAFLITTLYQYKVSKKILIPLFAFYALYPIVPSYNCVMWKDVWFGGAMIGFLVVLLRITKIVLSGKNEKVPVWLYLLYVMFSFGVGLLRTNGLYALIITFAVLILFFIRKNIKLVIASVIALTLVITVQYPIINNVIKAEQVEIVEVVGIPLEHISRAIKDGGELKQNEEEFLSNFIDVDKIADAYTGDYTDPIKALIREKGNQDYLKNNLKEFIKIWFTIGVRNPLSYAKAQIDQTIGYWYIDVNPNAYPWFIRDNGLDITLNPKLPATVSSLIQVVENLYYFIPVFSMFWSIGVYTWMLMLAFSIFFVRKNKKYLILFALPIAYFITIMLAVPVFAELRYYYGVILSAPFMLALSLSLKENNFSNE